MICLLHLQQVGSRIRIRGIAQVPLVSLPMFFFLITQYLTQVPISFCQGFDERVYLLRQGMKRITIQVFFCFLFGFGILILGVQVQGSSCYKCKLKREIDVGPVASTIKSQTVENFLSSSTDKGHFCLCKASFWRETQFFQIRFSCLIFANKMGIRLLDFQFYLSVSICLAC